MSTKRQVKRLDKNRKEQERVKEVNKEFENLRRALGAPRVKKVVLLRKAISHIRKLQSELSLVMDDAGGPSPQNNPGRTGSGSYTESTIVQPEPRTDTKPSQPQVPNSEKQRETHVMVQHDPPVVDNMHDPPATHRVSPMISCPPHTIANSNPPYHLPSTLVLPAPHMASGSLGMLQSPMVPCMNVDYPPLYLSPSGGQPDSHGSMQAYQVLSRRAHIATGPVAVPNRDYTTQPSLNTLPATCMYHLNSGSPMQVTYSPAQFLEAPSTGSTCMQYDGANTRDSTTMATHIGSTPALAYQSPPFHGLHQPAYGRTVWNDYSSTYEEGHSASVYPGY